MYLRSNNHHRMDNLLVRIAALLVHIAANFLLITWAMDFDITGSWLAVAGFVCAVAILLVLLIWHFTTFLFYLKNRSK